MSTLHELNRTKRKLGEDLNKTKRAVKAKEELVARVMEELGSLANNKHQVGEILGVRVKKQLNLPSPPVSILVEWTLVYEECLCVSLKVENGTKFYG